MRRHHAGYYLYAFVHAYVAYLLFFCWFQPVQCSFNGMKRCVHRRLLVVFHADLSEQLRHLQPEQVGLKQIFRLSQLSKFIVRGRAVKVLLTGWAGASGAGGKIQPRLADDVCTRSPFGAFGHIIYSEGKEKREWKTKTKLVRTLVEIPQPVIVAVA